MIWYILCSPGSNTFLHNIFMIWLTNKFPWRFSCCQTQRLFNVRPISCGRTWGVFFLHCQRKYIAIIKSESHIIITFYFMWMAPTKHGYYWFAFSIFSKCYFQNTFTFFILGTILLLCIFISVAFFLVKESVVESTDYCHSLNLYLK